MEPPIFSSPTSLKCEGYWDMPFRKGYQPIPSSLWWKDKFIWVAKVEAVENYLKRFQIVIRNDQYHTGYVSYRGISPARLIKNEFVGNGEFYDRDYDQMCWPEGYVKHYIVDLNVMPTYRFIIILILDMLPYFHKRLILQD